MGRAGLPLPIFAVLFLALALAGPALTASAQDAATPEAGETAGDEGTTTTGEGETPLEEGTVEVGTVDETEPPVTDDGSGKGEDGTTDEGVAEEPTEEPTEAPTEEPAAETESTDESVDPAGVGGNGTFTITKYDTTVDQANLLAGSCFEVYEDLDPDPGELDFGDLIVNICDVNDQDPGHVLNRNQEPGDYILAETIPPAGYDGAPDQEFIVVTDQDTLLDVINTPQNLGANGLLSIVKVNADNTSILVGGACFTVFENDSGQRGDPVGTETCDDDSNGLLQIPNLAPDSYLLGETDPPGGFENPTDDTPFTITAGEVTEVVVENTPLPSFPSFILTKEDENGDPVEGACFEVYEDLDDDVGEVVFGDLIVGGIGLCSDSTGFILHRNQEEGHYVAVEVVTPDGLISVDAFEFEVTGPSSPATVVDEFADADTPGKVAIQKREPGGDPLTDACFQVFEDDDGEPGDPVSDEVCDDDDGQSDARLTIADPDLLEGSYLLVETDAPSGFDEVANQEIDIVRGQTLHLTLVDPTEGGGEPSGFVATKVDEDGNGIEDACFTFHEDLDPDPGVVELGDLLEGSGTLCSEANGFILNRFQEPGDYVAVEETVPDGFAPAPFTEFSVEDGEQTVVEIVNHLAGTLTIRKFFCDGDEDAVEFEVDEPDAFDAAGIDEDDCDAGDAEFQITLFDDITFAPFSIGDDGEVTFDDLPETVDDAPHTLTEVDSGESVDFDIAPGEETIVTVFNIEAADDDEDDEDDEDDVEELPDTGVLGSGSGPANGAAGLLALMSLATLGLAYTWQRRRRIA